MGRVDVDKYGKQINSDVFTLTNITNNQMVALIPSDSAGNFNWSGIRRAPLERNAMQTTTSSGEWSDLEYPWMAIQQEDWTGGRGNNRFTSDKSRFYDSKRAQSAFNNVIINAPLDYYADGIKSYKTNCPASLKWLDVVGSSSYIYQEIEFTSSTSIGEVYIHLKRTGKPKGNLVVKLQNSIPGTATEYGDDISSAPEEYASKTFTTSNVSDITAEFFRFSFTNVTLSGTVYLVVSSTNGDSMNHWSVGTSSISGYNCYTSSDGASWVESTTQLLYRLQQKHVTSNAKFFTYKQLTFMVKNVGNTVTLWMNGDIGQVSAASASNTLTDSTKSWTDDAWIGAQVGIMYGRGIEFNDANWSNITDNTSNTLTMSSSISINTSSQYIITNTPHWKKVSASLIEAATRPCTDVLVCRDMVFFCFGIGSNVISMQWTGSSFQFIDMGFKADYLQVVRSAEGLMLWRAVNYFDANRRHVIECAQYYDYPSSDTTICTTADDSEIGTGTLTHKDYDIVEYALTVSEIEDDKTATIELQESYDAHAYTTVGKLSGITDNGTYYLSYKFKFVNVRTKVTSYDGTENHVKVVLKKLSKPRWKDHFTFLDNYGIITRLFEYGSDAAKSLWVFQEGMVSSVTYSSGTYNVDRINIDELATTADKYNGKAVATSDVYLLFGWLNGVQRYYNTQLEGKGPDKDEGLPANRRGRVSQILSYPSNWFVSVDAGTSGYSSVLMFNQNGWHEIYRAPNIGERITDIAFQPIYGDAPDKLWMYVGDNIVWLAMPSKTLYALHDPNAKYTHESVIVSSWITGGMAEVDKLWQGITIMSENLDGTNCWVEVDYQVDDEEEWHTIANNFVTSPSQEEDFSEYSVNGKKLRYRLRLQTTDISKSPKINAVLIKAIGRVDVKYSYSFYFRNIKYKSDLMGEYEDIEPYDLQCLLDDWANKLYKLRLNSAYKIFDDKLVFLDAVETSVLNELSEGYLGQITLTEV